MSQRDLFEDDSHRQPNLAHIRHLSPFRYPGGKSWFVPYLKRWLHSLQKRPDIFLEPFGGGGIAGLTVAAENMADKVLLVELDENVAAVWTTIFEDGQARWLADQIINFQLTRNRVTKLLAEKPEDTRQRAFQTLVKNRVRRGGILTEGAGLMRQGEDGRGIASRWYPKTLRKRILALELLKDRVEFLQGDGLEVMASLQNEEGVACFNDPPYTLSDIQKGSRLYHHNQLDHRRLFALCQKLKGEFVMTYDQSERGEQFADEFGFGTREVTMHNTHNTEKKELVIGEDLSWL